MSRIEGYRGYELTRGDLAKLIVGNLKLSLSASSPLQEICRLADASVPLDGKDSAEMLGDAALLAAVRVLAAPEHVLTQRLGGGMLAFEESTLCQNRQVCADFVALHLEDEGLCLITLFPNTEAYATWWSTSFGTKEPLPSPNYIPPKVSLSEFLFVLHTIDAFRRASYTSLLQYQPRNRAFISYPELFDSFKNAIAARDIRWLLPSFLLLMPGLSQYPLDMAQQDMDVLTRMGLIENGQTAGNNTDVALFAEAGTALGVEFTRTWMFAAGFEVAVANANGKVGMDHFFVAPTAMANHFVRLEITPDGRAWANHQTYTPEQLISNMADLLDHGFSSTLPESNPAPSGSFPTGTAAFVHTNNGQAAPLASAPQQAQQQPLQASFQPLQQPSQAPFQPLQQPHQAPFQPLQQPSQAPFRPLQQPSQAPFQPLQQPHQAPPSAKPVFCIHCGQLIDATSRFCGFCGKPQA